MVICSIAAAVFFFAKPPQITKRIALAVYKISKKEGHCFSDRSSLAWTLPGFSIPNSTDSESHVCPSDPVLMRAVFLPESRIVCHLIYLCLKLLFK